MKEIRRSASGTGNPSARRQRILRSPQFGATTSQSQSMNNKMKLRKMRTGFLIDMDGVIYRENQLIAGAADFVDALASTGTPFLFLTNNSAPTPEDLAVRLKHLGIPNLAARHFYTSALNAADLLNEMHPTCPALVIGEGGLLAALHQHKIANDAMHPSYVVVGEG